MEDKKNNTPLINDDYIGDYSKLMQTSDKTVIINVEWTKEGDDFKKFSLYENYTPVRTSCSTILISNL